MVVSISEQVANNIATRRLFARGERILVAVSGGVDSMVLLRVLDELSNESGWKLTVAHLNHRLRGVSSSSDERLVRRTAEALKLPIVSSQADIRRFARDKGFSLEMAGRKLRHDFLARAARERGIGSIAMAHHLDDQVELFFLRLLRGSGSQGLAGMKWRSPSPGNPRITLVRPLLDCPKRALRQYALERKIRFREDATNRSLDLLRNRVRNELLPLLEGKYQAGIGKTVARVMEILAVESDFLNGVAEAWLEARHRRPTHQRGLADANFARLLFAFETGSFEILPVAVQRRCLQLELIRGGVSLGFDLVEHLRLHPEQPVEVGPDNRATEAPSAPARRRKPRATPATARFCLLRNAQGLVRSTTGVKEPFQESIHALNLQRDRGKLDWEGIRLKWQILPMRGMTGRRRTPGSEFFDAAAVGTPVILRHWRPGDRFQPIGMAKAVKLQDLFVNQKVPRERRRHLAVATTCRGEVFWVEGLRMSERFKLTESTIRRLHWAWQRL